MKLKERKKEKKRVSTYSWDNVWNHGQGNGIEADNHHEQVQSKVVSVRQGTSNARVSDCAKVRVAPVVKNLVQELPSYDRIFARPHDIFGSFPIDNVLLSVLMKVLLKVVCWTCNTRVAVRTPHARTQA